MSAWIATPVRNFSADLELVSSRGGRCLVTRERDSSSGAHVYHAFELGDPNCYSITRDGFGRVDTLRRKPATNDYLEAVGWLLEQQRRARELIREVCPETIGEPRDAVYEGPGYITLLTRPERRHAAYMASRRPD